MYTITATFAGTNSLLGIKRANRIDVTDAASATAAPTATPVSAADIVLCSGIAAVLIVIIIVGAVLALLTS